MSCNVISLHGTPTSLTASLSSLMYLSPPNYVGTDIVTVSVSDSGGAGPGGGGGKVATADLTLIVHDFHSGMLCQVIVTHAATGVMVSATNTTVTEGSAINFNITLRKPSLADVAFPVQACSRLSVVSSTVTVQAGQISTTGMILFPDDDTSSTPQLCDVIIGPSWSSDLNFAGLTANMTLTLIDKDVAAVRLEMLSLVNDTVPGGGFVLAESQNASGALVLTSRPTSSVMVQLHSSLAERLFADPEYFVFTPSNWNVSQHVTLSSPDNDYFDPMTWVTITVTAGSNDPMYNLIPADTVRILLIDYSSGGFVQVSPPSGNTSDYGQKAFIYLVLAHDIPEGETLDVTLESSDTRVGLVTPTALTLTNDDFRKVLQAVVIGQHDFRATGDVYYTVRVTVRRSSGLPYVTVLPLYNIDMDTAGLNLTRSDLVTDELGNPDSVAFCLTSEPVTPVTVTVTSQDPTDVSVLGQSVFVFDQEDWRVPRTIVVQGIMCYFVMYLDRHQDNVITSIPTPVLIFIFSRAV